jgi:hypothetical protein
MNTEILMNIWLALNIVFGLFTANNCLVWVRSKFLGRVYYQNDLGRMLDLIIIASCLAYYFSI